MGFIWFLWPNKWRSWPFLGALYPQLKKKWRNCSHLSNWPNWQSDYPLPSAGGFQNIDVTTQWFSEYRRHQTMGIRISTSPYYVKLSWDCLSLHIFKLKILLLNKSSSDNHTHIRSKFSYFVIPYPPNVKNQFLGHFCDGFRLLIYRCQKMAPCIDTFDSSHHCCFRLLAILILYK